MCQAFAGLESVNSLTLNLSYNSIDVIDRNAFSNTSVYLLDLSFNRLQSLQPDLFTADLGFKLTVLLLAGNTIDASSLRHPRSVLTSLVNLETLDLSLNGIEQIPNGAFSSQGQLLVLMLSGNVGLSSLSAASLQGLDALLELDVGSTRVTSLPCDVFDVLPSLIKVTLSSNGISDLAALLTGNGGLDGQSTEYCYATSIAQVYYHTGMRYTALL